MRILLTAGPTREPIDPVRYIGNRSSGQMGVAIAKSAIAAGHSVTGIFGPVSVSVPETLRRIDVESSRQMHDAVLKEFPNHDLLIMAAAVADFRPKTVRHDKVERGGTLTIDLEPTEDILAAAGKLKHPNQRTVGFSLVSKGNIARSLEKLKRKHLDLIVSNPLETMNSGSVDAILLWPDGRSEEVAYRTKADFADILLQRATELFA